MDYIPATEKDIKEMLNLVGVSSINDLVRELTTGPYERSCPYKQSLAMLYRRRSLQSLYPISCEPPAGKGRSLYRIHALPGRNEPRDLAGHI